MTQNLTQTTNAQPRQKMSLTKKITLSLAGLALIGTGTAIYQDYQSRKTEGNFREAFYFTQPENLTPKQIKILDDYFNSPKAKAYREDAHKRYESWKQKEAEKN